MPKTEKNDTIKKKNEETVVNSESKSPTSDGSPKRARSEGDSNEKTADEQVKRAKVDKGRVEPDGKEDVSKEKSASDQSDSKKDSSENNDSGPKFVFGSASKFSTGFGISNKSPSPAFGSSTSFGGGFSTLKKEEKNDKKKNEEKDEQEEECLKAEKEKKEENPSNKPAAFGSGFAFGAGFKTLNKDTPSAAGIFETNNGSEKKSGDEGKEKSKKNEKGISSGTPSNDGVVQLTKQEIKSGEEAEESVYQANAKLYQLTSIKEGWKERGIGAIHVNKHPESGKARVVMRSRGLLKVILNLPLIKGFSVQKGFPGSIQGEKFIRILAVDENKIPVQYALKTGKGEIADELYDNITKLIP